MARMLSCLITVLMFMQGGGLTSADHLCTCTRGTWGQIDGALKHVSVGRAGVWGVNTDDNIYYRVGSYDDEENTGDTWMQTDGALKQVDVGHNVVWGVNSADGIYYRQGITATRPQGTSWAFVSGLLKHVSVSQKGHVWGVNADDGVFHRVGASNCNVPGNEWRYIAGESLKQISVGSVGVWGVSSINYIYYRVGTHDDPDSDPDGSSWTHIDGLLKYISSSDMIYGVNAGNSIYRRLGISAGTPGGTGWRGISRALKQIEFLSVAVWGVDNEDDIYVTEAD